MLCVQVNEIYVHCNLHDWIGRRLLREVGMVGACRHTWTYPTGDGGNKVRFDNSQVSTIQLMRFPVHELLFRNGSHRNV